ncbi:hypothetical protein JCM5350_002767 [Sporobolomyces pararoseus]
MLTSEATLVYGLTVRSSALFFAADAWKRLKVQFPFFNLIFLRRREGRLITTGAMGAGPVTQVPNEVWKEVRYWLVQEEIADSEEKHLRPLLCTAPSCYAAVKAKPRISWKDFRQLDECAEIDAKAFDWMEENVSIWKDSKLPVLKTLTGSFGLALPLNDPVLIDPESWNDPDTLALIAAPSKLEHGGFRSPFVTSYCGYDAAPSEQTLVQVSFELPPDINSRFSHFIRLFNLQVIDSNINKISSKGGGGTKPPISSTNGKSSGVKNEVTKRIVPSWSLYVTGFET